ncbi:MAG: STAS/SEC14 domain-containing protein [Ramlibacter sp.]
MNTRTHTPAMQVRVLRLLDYVDVELRGSLDLQQLLELIRKLGELSREAGDQRLLFDLVALEGDVPLTAQLRVGEQIVHSLSHLSRVGSVVATDKITRTSEKVARSHGVVMRVFDSKDEAITWLRESKLPSGEPATGASPMEPAHAALWDAMRHLFPLHAQAIQLPNATLAISWATSEPGAVYDMAVPITVRLEPQLMESLLAADDEQRKRIAADQETAFRAGLMGYDPYSAVPRARVIVLG